MAAMDLGDFFFCSGRAARSPAPEGWVSEATAARAAPEALMVHVAYGASTSTNTAAILFSGLFCANDCAACQVIVLNGARRDLSDARRARSE